LKIIYQIVKNYLLEIKKLSKKKEKIFNRVLYGVDVVIFNSEGEILMLKRDVPAENFKTGWEYIKGGVKEDETYSKAAIREIKEEAGIQVELISEIDKTFEVDARYRKKPHYDFVKKRAFVFIYKNGDISLDPSEHIDYKWMSFDEAQKHIWVEFGKKILENAQKIFNEKYRQ